MTRLRPTGSALAPLFPALLEYAPCEAPYVLLSPSLSSLPCVGIPQYALTDMDILYHYCSTASFHAITQSHALWLSSLSLSNDTMEGKLITRTVARLADKDLLDNKYVRPLLDVIRCFEEIVHGLGFCLSEKGDLLSQWRGYAGDATGVAIGFSVEYLKWLSSANRSRGNSDFTLEKVEYEPSAHEARVEPVYRKITQLIKDGALEPPGKNRFRDRILSTETEKAVLEARKKLTEESMPLVFQLFCLKSFAFEEEHEWRLLSHLAPYGENACLHRVVDNRIVPYCKVELVELGRGPIVEVILGPKHDTPPGIVKNFLKMNGYDDVTVKKSEASYR